MKKSVVFLIHISFWAIIYITMYTVLPAILKDPFPPVGGSPFWTFGWLSIDILVSVLIPFYSFYVLFPRLTGKKHRLLWYTIAFTLLVIYPAFIIDTDGFEFKAIDTAFYPGRFLSYMFVAFIGGLFRVFFNWIAQNKQRDNLEKQNLKSELALLKYQINPHFLFNTLNNVDSLMSENVQDASTALNKLSEIMRYMIYDSEKEKVSLNDELAYIESYLSLQKLRIANEDRVSFHFTGNVDKIEIAPMLFITFIENAFKHSSLKTEGNSISIQLDVSDTQINFSCTNSLPSSPAKKDESSGIGLELIKKRLDLIYPEAHELRIEKTEQRFAVYLKIKTNAN
ncbi:MAG: sensor histidine kinase [Bacteroidales bacterium]|nr:sensor histidine kinase [Bacteroidales bacterium]